MPRRYRLVTKAERIAALNNKLRTPRHPFGAEARCLAHTHVVAARLAVIFYEISDNAGASITNAAEDAATAYLALLPGRTGNEVLWLEAYPPEAYDPPRERFTVDVVTYDWTASRAARPRWRPAEPGMAEKVRELWHTHGGPELARRYAR